MRAVTNTVQKLLLAAPRGYCAGVDRAVQTVERALEMYGAPVYVRREIVHNQHVVSGLRERGAVFVEEQTEVPKGAVCVFSAHGVAPSVREGAQERGLQTIDATCPLVTKVHREAVRFAQDGYTVVLVGHDGHEEVEGTMGEAPEQIVLVQCEQDVDELRLRDPERVAYITQTTLAVDETTAIVARLHERFRHRRSAHRRHLLRHDQPPGGGQADGGQLRSDARDRLAQLVQLNAPGGGRPRLWNRRASDRQRKRSARAVARRQARRRDLLRGERARQPRADLVDFFRARGVRTSRSST